MKTLFRALLLGFAVTAYAYTDEALADQIVDLPGAPDVSFNQFAGYLTVDENTVRFRVIASTLPQPYPSSVNRCETGQEVLGPSHVRSLALLHRPLSPRSALRPLTLAPPLLRTSSTSTGSRSARGATRRAARWQCGRTAGPGALVSPAS